MSSNYSAGQYEDAFSPKRLRNWENTDKKYSQRPNINWISKPKEFIANERGHLLPGVPRKQSNAWGCLLNGCQNKAFGCPCTLNRVTRKSVNFARKKYQIPSFYKKKSKENNNSERPEAPRKIIDPYLNYLRDIQLPTIWIVGYPTESIVNIRRRFTKDLAENLNFCYIELQEQILKWAKRASESEDKNHQNDSEFHAVFNALPQSKITYDTLLPFTTEKILELLKFAMIEGLPCKGFVLDCFPCNLEEAGEFEKMFYPAALGMFFVAGTVGDISGCKIKYKKNCQPKHIAGTDPILYPQQLRRKYHYSHEDAMLVCNTYGRKVAMIVNSEDIDRETVEFLEELVQNNLDKYQDILSGEAKLECNLVDDSPSCSSNEECEEESYKNTPINSCFSTNIENSFINLPPPLVSCSGSISSVKPFELVEPFNYLLDEIRITTYNESANNSKGTSHENSDFDNRSPSTSISLDHNCQKLLISGTEQSQVPTPSKEIIDRGAIGDRMMSQDQLLVFERMRDVLEMDDLDSIEEIDDWFSDPRISNFTTPQQGRIDDKEEEKMSDTDIEGDCGDNLIKKSAKNKK